MGMENKAAHRGFQNSLPDVSSMGSPCWAVPVVMSLEWNDHCASSCPRSPFVLFCVRSHKERILLAQGAARSPRCQPR